MSLKSPWLDDEPDRPFAIALDTGGGIDGEPPGRCCSLPANYGNRRERVGQGADLLETRVWATSSSQRRLMAESGSCESQTWPNISRGCITGQAEPAKVAERPAVVPEQPSSILLRPTKLPETLPDSEVTGSVAASEQLTIRERERPAEVVSRKPRERPVTAKATRPQSEQRARAEQKTARDAGRRNRSSPIIAIANRAAPEPAARAAEPIQFRLAEGNR